MAVLYLKGDVSRDGLIVKRGQILRNRWGNMCFRFDIEKSLSDYITAAAITFTRATSATYFDSAGVLRTAASGAARFDYNPSTLKSLGLLVEEQRTNGTFSSAIYTDDLTTATGGWGNINCTVTADQTTAPDGTNTASLITATGSGARVEKAPSAALANGAWTLTCFAKAGSQTTFYLAFPTNYFASAQLGLGTYTLSGSGSAVASGEGTGAVASIVALPNGWYRCVLTCTIDTAVTTSIQVARLPSSGTAYAWGPQLESGSFATSFIPISNAASVTRNADVATMTGANFSSWFNASEGTFVAEADIAGVPATSGRVYVAALSTDFSNNQIRLVFGSTAAMQVTDGGVTQANLNGGSINTNTFYRHAFCYKANDFAASLNGGAVVTDSSGTIPSVNQLGIGYLGSGTTTFLNGHIRRISYWNRRLSNDKLVSLSSGKFK